MVMVGHVVIVLKDGFVYRVLLLLQTQSSALLLRFWEILLRGCIFLLKGLC